MILVTGGLGFIGSHTVVALQEKGHDVLIVDDLSNSTIEVLEGIEAASGTLPKFQELIYKTVWALQGFLNPIKLRE